MLRKTRSTNNDSREDVLKWIAKDEDRSDLQKVYINDFIGMLLLLSVTLLRNTMGLQGLIQDLNLDGGA